MRQRLGIAQALMGDPEVLLLDEPASALDPIGRKEILDLIASLRGRATIIMSSHILDDVQRICTWVGIMRRGGCWWRPPWTACWRATPGRSSAWRWRRRPPSWPTALRAGALAARGRAPRGAACASWQPTPTEAQRRIPVLVAELGVRLVEFVTVTPDPGGRLHPPGRRRAADWPAPSGATAPPAQAEEEGGP